MAVKMKEVIEGTEETAGMRLRKARDDKGLTRSQVFEQTNIPVRSLEKIEGGQQEPSLARVQTLCELYGVAMEWVTNGGTAKAETSVQPETTSPKIAPANENDPVETLRGMLADLDDMREHAFENVQRGAMALSADIHDALKYLEPSDLLILAVERGLSEDESHNIDTFFDLFNDDADKAQAFCGNIEDRIVDTALIGIDLYAMEETKLEALADELGVELPGNNFWEWWDAPDKMELIVALRPKLRAMSIVDKLKTYID
ncbi:helix-turn-helix transcriptional regulator [Magnetovibrio sp.]|uniref:helix-turn-helix domain-containing protein n=1 Tax=Magnetovibrio sp. TaxID=2024836 RepID=UPI002F951400